MFICIAISGHFWLKAGLGVGLPGWARAAMLVFSSLLELNTVRACLNWSTNTGFSAHQPPSPCADGSTQTHGRTRLGCLRARDRGAGLHVADGTEGDDLIRVSPARKWTFPRLCKQEEDRINISLVLKPHPGH